MCLVFVYPQRLNKASMGPCPFRHGYIRDASTSGRALWCFNGAMPFQAWIHWHHADTQKAHQRFNGAMPFQAWIPIIEGWNEDRYIRLQWGHALSGMDTHY